MPTFEFDPVKSAANRAKHGIDFVAGQALWQDDGAIEAPARTEGEPRFLVEARSEGPRGQRSSHTAGTPSASSRSDGHARRK